MRRATPPGFYVFLGFLLLGAPTASAQTPRDVIARAVRAMGGEAVVRGLSIATLYFNAATFALGQEETPAAPARATLGYGLVTTDWQRNRRPRRQDARPLTGRAQPQAP